MVLDTDIHDGLGKERQHQLQGTARKQSQDYPGKCLAVFLEISEKELEGTLLLLSIFSFHLISEEGRSGLEEHGDTLVLVIGMSTYPMPSEFFKIISCLSLARVSNIELLALLHLI